MVKVLQPDEVGPWELHLPAALLRKNLPIFGSAREARKEALVLSGDSTNLSSQESRWSVSNPHACSPSGMITHHSSVRIPGFGLCPAAGRFLSATSKGQLKLPLQKISQEKIWVHGHCHQKAANATGSTLGILKTILDWS